VIPPAFAVLAARGAAGFAFNPARKAATITLSISNTKATESTGGSLGSAFAVAPIDTAVVTVFTVNLLGGGTGVGLGAGNVSASTGSFVGSTSNGYGLIYSGQLYVNNSVIASTGITFTTGDVIRMRNTATQVQFSKNGGAYSTLVTHGVAGALTPAVTLFDLNDAVTGALE